MINTDILSRSMIQSIALFTNAISAAIAEALVPLAGDPLLIWNYGVFAVLSFAGGCIFMIHFRSLDKEEDALNMLPEGRMTVGHDLEDGITHALGGRQSEEK